MTKTHIEHLKELVDELYLSCNPERDSWADYLFEHHIYLVAEQSVLLTKRFGGDQELVYAGSILHDIADAVMSRFDTRHEFECLRIAQDFLTRAGFSDREIVLANDILMHHSCRDALPQTGEGKIMATADAIVHLKSDFYPHALKVKQDEGESLESIRKWALQKIERDFHTKIFFDQVREEVRGEYEKARYLFLN